MSTLEGNRFAAAMAVEFQAQLTDLTRTSGRLEGKLDAFLAKQAEQDKRLSDLDERHRNVEARQNKLAGASTVLGMASGGLVALLVHYLKFN
jgi:hypothetical protein